MDAEKNAAIDWLLYKNGAKNSVYKFKYPTNGNQTYEMIFKNNGRQIDLSKIVIGFEQDWNDQKTFCIPT